MADSQPTASSEENIKLYRAPSEGYLGGVSVGLADYISATRFELDSIYIMAAFVGLTMLGIFFMPIIYLVLWLVLPIEGEEEQPIIDRVKTNVNEVIEKLTALFEQIRASILGLGLNN